MLCQNIVGRLLPAGLIVLVLGPSFSVHAQNQGIFSGLPYDENFIREKIARYSITAESTDASWKIPANLSYQLAFREILADKNLQARISASDLDLIKNLPAPWDQSFLAKDQQELGTICKQAAPTNTPAQIQDLAVKFDSSRKRKERDLDAFYAAALSKLTVATRKIVEDLMVDSGASKKISYATFDMTGFAQEVPEAAKAILLNGCENFNAQLLSQAPYTVTLGDL